MARKYDKPERARRYAKTIASDIKLYNMRILEKAIMEDSVFETMAEFIDEGIRHYKDRVTPEILELKIFERILVDVLLYEMRNVKAPIF
jgi:hypothetical protein